MLENEVQRIVSMFLEKPYAMRMGAAKLARWWKTDDTTVRLARELARESLNEYDIDKHSMPKILLFDIETSPLKVSVYQKSVWRANITADQVLSEWFMLSWSAKWLGSEDTMSDRLKSKEALGEDDSRIVKSLWALLDQADIVISHNGSSFDLPNINVRFLINNLDPPSPYQSIDTYNIAKKQFGFTHNSLNGIAKVFGFNPKMETNFQLWKDCVDGKEDALAYMEQYNRYDVDLLELVYLKLRPWIKGHPNVGLYIESDSHICPNCGSDRMVYTGKYYYTSVSRFETMRCESCGAIARQRKNTYPSEKNGSLLSPVFR